MSPWKDERWFARKRAGGCPIPGRVCFVSRFALGEGAKRNDPRGSQGLLPQGKSFRDETTKLPLGRSTFSKFVSRIVSQIVSHPCRPGGDPLCFAPFSWSHRLIGGLFKGFLAL